MKLIEYCNGCDNCRVVDDGPGFIMYKCTETGDTMRGSATECFDVKTPESCPINKAWREHEHTM